MAIAQAGQQMDHQDLAGLSMGEGDVYVNEVNQEHHVVQEQRPQIGQRHRGRLACSLKELGAGAVAAKWTGVERKRPSAVDSSYTPLGLIGRMWQKNFFLPSLLFRLPCVAEGLAGL